MKETEMYVMTQEKKKKPVIKTIFNIFSNILLVFLGLLIIYMLYFMFTGIKSDEPPMIFNHRLYIVQSDSMSPTFRRGSLLIIKQIDTDSIKVGDIITYRKAGDSLATTHRVTEIIEEDGAKKFVTKGDANNINDPVPVDQEYVIGKVAFFIPYIGFVMAFVRTKQGTLLVIVIPALILMITQIIELTKYRKKYRSEVQEENIKPES